MKNISFKILVVSVLNMAQLNIGLGLGFSSISVPDLELEESWSKDRFWHGEEIAKVQTRWRMSPGYMHSFSVTDNYYVLIEQPLCINIPKMARSLLSRLVKTA